MAEEEVHGLQSVAVRDDKGKHGSTQVEISYRRMTIRPPIAKRKRYLKARRNEYPSSRRVSLRLPGDRSLPPVFHW